ncbi:MAG: cyanophycin synthetase [Patescibacteria group bacterium]
MPVSTYLKIKTKRMSKFERYYQAVNFLEGFNNLPLPGDYLIDKHHADVYLKRMRYFLNLLGNPDKGLKFIHIAGTAGKGTVTNMVHKILDVAGKKVGSFTSPSVTTSIEKIKVKDKYISPDEFADIVDYLKPFIDQAYVTGSYGRPSDFEIFLAMALVYFHRQKCDWVILEVGLGGRYDATNIITKPLITAITNIDYDHTELLGKTLKKIAYDKAGIIKRGSAVFTTEQRPSLLKIFAEIGREKHVSLRALPRQNNYQEYNEELATAIARQVGISDKYITQGTKNTRLVCRFEVVQNKPLIVLDGAHNRSKIKTTIDNLRKLKFAKLYLIIGIADNKDHVSILAQIIPRADYVFFTRFQNKDRKCAHPKELLAKSQPYFKQGTGSKIYLDPASALAKALKLAKTDDLILVAGSFFLAGGLRKHWYPEDLILKQRKSF